jgi:patatin-like phospholipase/acyl hydrolase
MALSGRDKYVPPIRSEVERLAAIRRAGIARPRKVLSIDGGGIRGLVPVTVLMHLEAELGRPLHEVFDLVVGTSTGGILAVAVGAGLPMEKVLQLYHKEAKRIFNASFWWKLRSAKILKGPKYPATGLRETLIDYLGRHNGFGEMRTKVMVTAFATEVDRAMDGGIDWITGLAGDFLGSQAAVVEYLDNDRSDIHRVAFRPGGKSDSVALLKSWRRKYQGILTWQAAYATAAAPTYFPGIVLGNRSYFDGGVYAQNPTAIADAEAWKLWPEAERIDIISMATIGGVEYAMDETDPKKLIALQASGERLWEIHRTAILERLGV